MGGELTGTGDALPDDPHTDAWQEAPADGHGGTPHLALGADDQLPWLESDEEAYQPVARHRIAVLGAAMVLLLLALVGAVYVFTHRHQASAPAADGSIVAPPTADYKAAPASPGGKTYAGTGDTSFAVSQGKTPNARLAAGGDATGIPTKPQREATAAAAAAADATGNASNGGNGEDSDTAPAATDGGRAAPKAAAADTSGGIVQLAAFNSAARAEAAWARFSSHPVLSGLKHRIISGQIDSGTVYRLQVLTAAGGGAALCGKIHAAGLACQVKQ